MSFAAAPAEVPPRGVAGGRWSPSASLDVRELPAAFAPDSPGGVWVRLALLLAAVACVAGLVALLPISPFRRVWAADLLMVLAPVSASSACMGARVTAAPGGRTTWLLISAGALLAALGQALAARAELAHVLLSFPSASFLLFVAFHIAFAEGAILALRPAHEPRLALEIALDGLLVLLGASALVLRFILDQPLTQGWVTLPQGVAMLLGQFAVAGSLFFVALLVFWRDAELAGPVVDGLLVSALFFAFGNFLVTFGLDPMPESPESALDFVRLAGWLALALTAGLAVIRPDPTPVKERRTLAARRFRQLIIPGAALFLTGWAVDAAGPHQASEPALAVVGAMGALLALRIGAALFAVERESEERRQAERRAARARLRAVTAQMSPHFLFNALHSLSALVRRDAEASERALERLGGLLRYGLDTGDDMVRLQDEWRFAQDYLDLEALRLGPRLEVSVEIDEETKKLPVPPFIVQPLVENAIRHGVSPFPDGGRIELRARLESGRLVVEVSDTGPGASPEDLANASGVGVRGVRAQLESSFGDDWRMETDHRREGGFVVRLVLPVDGGD